MNQHSKQTMFVFGHDRRNIIRYSFNSLGYRSDTEFSNDSRPVIVLGNSVSFGVGLDINDTFASIIGNNISDPVYNFAWGCFMHTNHDQLDLLKTIIQIVTPKHIIFQINNLDRVKKSDQVTDNNSRDTVVSQFIDFKTKLNLLLEPFPHTLLHWDNNTYELDFSDCLIYNKYHVDHSIENMPNTFGKTSHKLIATKILQTI